MKNFKSKGIPLSSVDKNSLPKWALGLVSTGELISRNAKENADKKLTVALCLPRVDYAAAFLGLGIMKARCTSGNSDGEQERLKQLVGKWVSFESPRKTAVGILEHCEDSEEFSIRLYSKIPKEESMTEEEWKNFQPPKVTAAWTVLMPKHYSKVHPTGRAFNEQRRVGTNQIQSVVSQNHSVTTLNKLLGTNFAEAFPEMTKSPFCIIGNKSRIQNELTDPLFENEKTCLAEILRPGYLAKYSDSRCCDILSARALNTDGSPSVVMTEGSRNLADTLVSSRGTNRIILLGRNSPAYEESVECLMDEFSIRKTEAPEIKSESSTAIITLPFYH